ASLRGGAGSPGLPDGLSQTRGNDRSPARTARDRASLAPAQPERPAGPVSNARNDRDVQSAVRRDRVVMSTPPSRVLAAHGRIGRVTNRARPLPPGRFRWG